MIKKISLILLIAVMLSCSQTQINENLTVVVSSYPLEFLANEIAQGSVDVKNLMPAGVDVHDFEPTPKDVAMLESSNLYIYYGVGEPWAKDLALQAKNSVDAAQGISLLETSAYGEEHDESETEHESESPEMHCTENNGKWIEETNECEGISSKLCIEESGFFEECASPCRNEKEIDSCIAMCVPVCSFGIDEHSNEAEHDEHDHGNFDPHIWLSPALMQIQADNVAAALSQANPANAIVYQQNAEALKQKLALLDEKFKTELSDCSKNTIVTSHSAFGYLAERYEFEQKSISGFSHESEPSAKTLAQITNFINSEQIKYVIVEDFVSPDLAETVAKETNANLIALHPLDGISENQKENGASWLSLMEENLKNLKVALDCK